MRIVRTERKRAARHGEAVILFNVAATTFAIAAGAVDEIRNLDGLQPVPPGFAHGRHSEVKYLLEREKKTYFVVDSNLHFMILPSRATRLLVLRHAPVAVLVDSIDRMAEITTLHALPHAFDGEERHWYRGLALAGEQVIPVVHPESYLSKAEIVVLQSSLAQSLAAAARTETRKGASA